MQEVNEAFLVNSKAQKKRYITGNNWERKIHTHFKKNGIVVDKRSVTTEDGKRISDHTFGETWMESTTHLDRKRTNELIDKKRLVEETNEGYKTFIIFFKTYINPTNPKHNDLKVYKNKLENAGFIFLDGWTNSSSFINYFGRQIGNGIVNKIRTARVEYVNINDISENPINRDINENAVQDITDSIISNGFFGAFFVVPHIVNGKQKGYMLFEGHHRLLAYKRVISWGLNISMNVPIINVDWMTSEEKEKLGELLIKVNVEYRSWQLFDYVTAQHTLAKQVKNVEKENTYQKLLDLRPISNSFKLGYNGLWYVVGPKKDNYWLDVSKIHDGTIRFDESYMTSIDDFNKMCESPIKDFLRINKKSKDFNVIKENLRAFLAREFERFKKNQDKKQTEMRLDIITTWNINNYPQSIEILDTDYQKIISEHVKKLERWSV